MIRRDPHWGLAEWLIVLIWKALTLAIAGVMGYLAVTGGGEPTSWGLRLVGIVYVSLGLAAFLFTQPDV